MWNFTPLFAAATRNGNPEVVQVLIQAGASLEVRDKWQYTPLHRAAENNVNPEIVQVLIQAGADLEVRDKWAYTPPASGGGEETDNPEVAKALVQAGASLEARNQWNYTPLHRAAAKNRNPAVLENPDPGSQAEAWRARAGRKKAPSAQAGRRGGPAGPVNPRVSPHPLSASEFSAPLLPAAFSSAEGDAAVLRGFPRRTARPSLLLKLIQE